ncbi:phospholipase D1/2 [Litoreibacter meonggei]|uniref:Phospholipase D n=1 Tax=Litoreibacter meonggei TaxID=1049199 RepID=A0A497W657_9RHOB|nr:phospholipase D-like domain-containing protein [Litoreibacter meonggei]RLJ51650.1 phospholipase D1/2 [Litoreibacter meonggei]
MLLTAHEAFPVLEREFLGATHSIVAGFRIFDPRTKLLSDEAKKVGDTWADLLVDTLNRGVQVTLFLSDFDPVVGLNEHRYSWECARGVLAAGEASDRSDLLRMRVSMHPARVGLLPRLILWPRLLKEIRSGLSDINQRSRPEKQAFLDSAPGLRPLLKWRGDMLVTRIAPPPLAPVTHHQKLAVFDRKRLYIGGLDLNDRRYDTLEHSCAADQTWHDTQVLVDGPVAAEAADHLESFEAVTRGDKPKPTRHLLRTISAKRSISFPFLSPRPVVNELAEAHHAWAARAERLIYLETQFFRDRRFAKQIAQCAKKKPALSLILILPAAPDDVAFVDEPSSDVEYGEHLQTKSLEILADGFGKRLFVGSPAQPRAAASSGRDTHYGAPIVYLHAKVSIFDDQYGTISSANLNGRSMAWDTEAGVGTESKQEVSLLKSRCFQHWLGTKAGAEFYGNTSARKAWAERAEMNANVPPDKREGFILPYSAEPAAELGRNLPGVPEEMV